MVAALQQSGCLNDTQKRGIEHLFYAQIDNPMVAACDSVLIGHHLMAESDMTTQVVKKRDPLERVGNVVSIDGRVQIIEYSDLPPSAAQMRNPDGSLKLWAGNIAVHVFRTSFLLSAATHQSSLPFHRALKKVPYVNEQGQRVEPDAPNAIKFERFIFDLLPAAKTHLSWKDLPKRFSHQSKMPMVQRPIHRPWRAKQLSNNTNAGYVRPGSNVHQESLSRSIPAGPWMNGTF